MEQIDKCWFREKNDLWPGECFSLEIEKVLFNQKSPYQDVMVIQTKSHGRALILDGIIQCTEHDEFSYQEMISWLPLCAHANPRRVLIVGGGDGGVARDVAKHPHVERIDQVEIDQLVIDVSKQFLPNMAAGFASPKVTVHVADGFEFLRQRKNEYDVIITDSSDPVGPAVHLFSESYFVLLKQALRPNGIICSQGGSIWSQFDHVKETIDNCRRHFPVVKYAYTSVPTYPTGQIGFVIASLDESVPLDEPLLRVTYAEGDALGLQYYNDAVHESAFKLPNFARKMLED